MDGDAICQEIYERAGYSGDEPVDPFELAERVLGEDCVEVVQGLCANAGLFRIGSKWRIWLRGRLPESWERFLVAHELAEYVLHDHQDEQTEHLCNMAAAAVLAPRNAFREAIRRFGRYAYEDLAEPFGLSQTAAALRVGEVTDEPLAVVSPRLVRVRGPQSWVWPSEPEIRQMAKRPGPGVARVRLTDDPRRAVLVAVG